MRTNFKLMTLLVAIAMLCSNAPAQNISVNFHSGNDDDSETPAQADHEVTTGETAGFVPVDGAFWNNINVGDRAAHNTAEALFPSTVLTDDSGNASAATIAPSVDSTFFVGYAASNANTGLELDLEGNDDDLFNSYLALNGPSGDGTPADAAILNINGLGAPYTTEGYELIIYSDSDRRGIGTNANNSFRQSIFTVTEAGGAATVAFTEDDDTDADPPVNTFSGTFVLGDGVEDGNDYSNYTIISGLTADSFSIEVTSPDGGRGAISGFQIRVNSDTEVVLGDANCDGMVSFLDISPFIGFLSSEEFKPQADVDGSGEIDFLDIAPFISILSGSGS